MEKLMNQIEVNPFERSSKENIAQIQKIALERSVKLRRFKEDISKDGKETFTKEFRKYVVRHINECIQNSILCPICSNLNTQVKPEPLIEKKIDELYQTIVKIKDPSAMNSPEVIKENKLEDDELAETSPRIQESLVIPPRDNSAQPGFINRSRMIPLQKPNLTTMSDFSS